MCGDDGKVQGALLEGRLEIGSWCLFPAVDRIPLYCNLTLEARVGALGSRIHTVPSTLLGSLYTLSHRSLHLIPIVQIEKN